MKQFEHQCNGKTDSVAESSLDKICDCCDGNDENCDCNCHSE